MGQKLGQHFLINKNAIEKIIAALELKNNETIIEIGPGKGALTIPLIKACEKIECKIIGIEKDKKIAQQLVTGKWKLEIIIGDALKIIPQLVSNYQLPIANYKIVGNIPYYITGKLMRILSELENKPSSIVLTVQKEVAERIMAQPPKMNLLAAATQFWAEPKIIGYLKPSDFSPTPEVESAIIKLTPRLITNYQLPMPTGKQAISNYYKLIKILFKQPRKTALNNLVDGLGISKFKGLEILKKIGLSGEERPQNLNINQIKQLLEIL